MEFRFSLPKSNRVRRLPKSSKVRLSDSFCRIVCQSFKVLREDQSRYLSRFLLALRLWRLKVIYMPGPSC
ncbi:hypothetical protein QL285_089602 [Trifolium repens]|nr:hypothetical protein QL285_089602 [Trifolium repens]